MTAEIERSFVLVQGAWTVEFARQLISADPAADHVIVLFVGADRDEYRLFSEADATELLRSAAAAQTVADALRLSEEDETPAVDAFAADSATGPAVVVDDGRLVGFLRRRVVVRGPGRGETAAEAAATGDATPRSLEAEFPESVVAGSLESLLVLIRAARVSAGGIDIPVPPGQMVDIVVQPRKGFEIDGPSEGTLEVPEDGETLPLQFKLRAGEAGQGRISVFAFHTGRPLGVIELRPSIGAARTDTTAETPRRARRKGKLVAATAAAPDLSMLVEERSYGDRIEYLIRLTAPELDLNLRPFGPLNLRVEPEAFFDEFFKDIEGMPLETAEQRAAASAKLEAKGAYLFDVLFPDDLKEQLWAARDRIKSVIVQSEEPWIPWELCRLQGREDGHVVEGPFLAEGYTITRWMPGIPFRPRLSMKQIALVVPDDSGLPLAAEERDYILSLAGSGHKVTAIPANYAAVREALASGTYDGWHFTGHGAARTGSSDRASIYLQAEEELTPLDLSGTASNLGAATPLVFLNACQVGRSGMSLTGIGGWARRFLEAGAGAFIGTYWSVYDTPAFDFAKEVYARLLNGTAIGQAVREARLAVREAGDPTWMAYTVFGEPTATVQ